MTPPTIPSGAAPFAGMALPTARPARTPPSAMTAALFACIALDLIERRHGPFWHPLVAAFVGTAVAWAVHRFGDALRRRRRTAA